MGDVERSFVSILAWKSINSSPQCHHNYSKIPCNHYFTTRCYVLRWNTVLQSFDRLCLYSFDKSELKSSRSGRDKFQFEIYRNCILRFWGFFLILGCSLSSLDRTATRTRIWTAVSRSCWCSACGFSSSSFSPENVSLAWSCFSIGNLIWPAPVCVRLLWILGVLQRPETVCVRRKIGERDLRSFWGDHSGVRPSARWQRQTRTLLEIPAGAALTLRNCTLIIIELWDIILGKEIGFIDWESKNLVRILMK